MSDEAMTLDQRVAREATRVKEENVRRGRELPADFYSPTRPANLFLRHGQERALLDALGQARLLPLRDKRILEVGCGTARWLELFTVFGARRRNLAGIDLSAERVLLARGRLLQADLQIGDATDLPWDDDRFDVVFQSTCVTSILDDRVRQLVAREMLRVLRPGGTVLWYDFRVDNPRNPHVRAVRRGELRRLFPGCRVRFARVTLAPPIARFLVPISWTAAALLESLRLLNTHDLAIVTPE